MTNRVKVGAGGTAHNWKLSLRITSPKNSALVFNGQISEAAKDVIVKALDECFDDLAEQRDKLLSALNLINTDKDGDGFICREAMEQVREAIARAEGAGA